MTAINHHRLENSRGSAGRWNYNLIMQYFLCICIQCQLRSKTIMPPIAPSCPLYDGHLWLSSQGLIPIPGPSIAPPPVIRCWPWIGRAMGPKRTRARFLRPDSYGLSRNTIPKIPAFFPIYLPALLKKSSLSLSRIWWGFFRTKCLFLVCPHEFLLGKVRFGWAFYI